MNKIITITLILLLSLPIAFITTILAMPLWRWIEVNLAIEAVGHSGPAEWCYLVSYVLINIVLLIARLLLNKRKPL